MNLPQLNAQRPPHRTRGSAVLIMLIFLSIIGIYLAGNVRGLRDLKRELQLTEQRQIRRLEQVRLPVVPVQRTETNLNARILGPEAYGNLR